MVSAISWVIDSIAKLTRSRIYAIAKIQAPDSLTNCLGKSYQVLSHNDRSDNAGLTRDKGIRERAAARSSLRTLGTE